MLQVGLFRFPGNRMWKLNVGNIWVSVNMLWTRCILVKYGMCSTIFSPILASILLTCDPQGLARIFSAPA